jgi:hypothetical protein
MNTELLASLELKEFPSATGIEYFDDHIYLLGNEGRELLVMTKKWKQAENVPLPDAGGKKNQKNEKAGLEALSLVMMDKKPHLLMLGSGAGLNHNKGFLMSLKTRKFTNFDLGEFYQRIQSSGLPELNIEAVALVYDYMILANRGSGAVPDNHLIITRPDFFQNQEKAEFQIIRLDAGSAPAGTLVSGLSYSDKHENLLLTFHGGVTDPATGAAASPKSYLGIIDNIYRKIGREKGKIKINSMIDLEACSEKFRGHKVESVCIQSEKDHSMKLQLVADDDRGSSYLFKVESSW